MSIVNSKFHVTFTEDTESYPSVDREINFTDSTTKWDGKDKFYIKPGTNADWHSDDAITLLDITSADKRVKYFLLETDIPINVWFGTFPEHDGYGVITTPEIRVERMMMLEGPGSGAFDKLYVVNPARTAGAGGTNQTASIKLYYTLVDLNA